MQGETGYRVEDGVPQWATAYCAELWLPRDPRSSPLAVPCGHAHVLLGGFHSLPCLRGNWSFEESPHSFPFAGTMMNS